MKCKLCNKEIDSKFYLHLNSSHKMKKSDYLTQFPEQIEEYNQQVPAVWCKGLTAKTNPTVAKIAESIKIHTNKPEIRKIRSERLKARYANGDILDAETRAKVVKAGSDGWVNRIKKATDEERLELLKNFTTAGNKAQEEKRHLLTPDDYNKMYPFAKGIARYHNCDFCKTQFIAWFGGKPRPKKRFCNQECWSQYMTEHPFYIFNNCKMYYSKKMQTEFCLHSKYELWLAEVFELKNEISSWCTSPFSIKYNWLGSRKYYPDFFINNKYVIEIKSDYVRQIQGEERTVAKLQEAEIFCSNAGYEFIYWQFDGNNKSKKHITNDIRVVSFLENLK